MKYMVQTDSGTKCLRRIHAQREELAFKSYINANICLYVFKYNLLFLWELNTILLKKNLQNAKKYNEIEPITSRHYFYYTYLQIYFLQWGSNDAQIYTKTLWLSLMNIFFFFY